MIFILLYQCLAGLLAWWNYWLIKNNRFKNIYHNLNGAVNVTAAFAIGYYTDWNYGVATFFYTRIVFDTVLNILREKGVGYISPDPQAWTDRIEDAIIKWIAGKVYSKKVFITDERLQWVAIWFRVFILIIATVFLLWN